MKASCNALAPISYSGQHSFLTQYDSNSILNRGFFVFNWFNRQQCKSFSKAESGSASCATVVEILKYVFFSDFKD